MNIVLTRKRIFLCLIFSMLLCAVLYRDSFSSYFFQDDWFTLRISRVPTIPVFFKIFIPRTDVIYYRPLGMQFPFWILQSLFGINPIPFHVLTFLVHCLNIVLVYILIRLLVKKNLIALLSAFYYSISTIHYIPFFWSSTFAFVAGPTAFFSSFILFLVYLRNKTKRFYIFSVLIFFLGLFINEIVSVLPLILFLYILLFNYRSKINSVLPYFILTVAFFTLRFIYFSPPTSGLYQIGLDKHVLNNLEGYILWSFNWPEEMKAQLINFYTINKQFIEDFTSYYYVFIFSLVLNIWLLLLFPLFNVEKLVKKEFLSLVFFSLFWFIIALAPVIFFPKHSFSYYLPIPIVGLLILCLSLFYTLYETVERKNRFLSSGAVMVLLVNWVLIAATTIEFNSKIHWANRRGKISRSLVSKTIKSYPKPITQRYIYVPFSSENKLALNDQDAFKVLYENEEIITVYGNNQAK